MSNNNFQRNRVWLARALVTLAFSVLTVLLTAAGAFAGTPLPREAASAPQTNVPQQAKLQSGMSRTTQEFPAGKSNSDPAALPGLAVNLSLDDGKPENLLGYGDGTAERAALWLNRFSPSGGNYPLSLTSIQIYWPDQGSNGNIIGLPIKLLVYSDPDGNGDPGNAIKLAEISGTVGITNTFQSYPVNVSVYGPGDMYIGFEDYWAEAGYAPPLHPAALDQTASQQRSWVVAMGDGAPPDLNNLANNDVSALIDSFGYPGNWLIRAVGNSNPANTQTPTNTHTNTRTRTSTNTPSIPTPTQCTGYQASPSGGGIITATNLVPGSRGDDVTASVTLPFPFQFYGVTRTSAVVSSNGNMQFASNGADYDNICLPAGTLNDVIAPYWDDLMTDQTPNQGIYTQVVGSAPNRQFVVQWVGCLYGGAECAPNSDVNFEIILTENTQTISIAYGATGGNNGASATSGVQRGVGNRFTQFSCDTATLANGIRVNYTTISVCGTNTRTPTITRTPSITVTSTPTVFTGGTIAGSVYLSGTTALDGALVYACQLDYTHCSSLMTTGPNGQYWLIGLAEGEYLITIFPPSSQGQVAPGHVGPIGIRGNDVVYAPDAVLTGPIPAPPGTYFDPSAGYDSDGIQHVPTGMPLTLHTTGCPSPYFLDSSVHIYMGPGPGGQLLWVGGVSAETPPGSGNYVVNLPPFPHNYVYIVIRFWCRGGGYSDTTIAFDVYVDPSGHVRTVNGDPLPNSTVTLYRSDSSNGTFTPVPNGSAMMSPANRQNPDTTDSTGHFGWDVVQGYYKVRAEHVGCTDPGNPNQPYVESAVLPIPPPVDNLDLRLSCPSIPTNTATGTSTVTSIPTNAPTDTSTATSTPTNTPQCGDYQVGIGAGTLIPATNLVPGSRGDDVSASIVLPFPVMFYGVARTGANVTSNGFMQFTDNKTDYDNTCLPAIAMSDLIAPYWDDLLTDQGANDGIFTAIVGSAPNRQFVIEWRGCLFGEGGECESDSDVDFEIILSENTQTITMVYGATGGNDGASATSGVQSSGGQFTQFSCNTATLTSGLRVNYVPLAVCITNTPTPTVTLTRTPTLAPSPTLTVTPTPICPDSWTLRGAYPVAVNDNGVTSVGGILYSFGGIIGGSTSAASYKYDPSTDTWTSIASLPAPRAKPGVVNDGTYIYIVGGSVTNTIWRYDPSTDTYQIITTSPTAPWAPAVAILNGVIYKIGGCTDGSCTASTNVVEAYNIAGNTWSTVAALPASVAWANSIGMSGYVYVAGGIDASTSVPSAKTYRYDPVSNTWNDAAIADMQSPRWGAASDILGGKWVVAAGVVGAPPNDNIDANVVVWDPGTNAWSPSIDPALQALFRIGAATVGSDFYMPGGRDNNGLGSSANQRYRNTCTTGSTLRGHLTWQGVQAANRPNVTGTLSICVSGAPQNYSFNTDASGFFTITTSLSNGTYNWSVKGGRHISNASPSDGTALTIAGGQATQEFGTQKGGNTNTDNIINSTDFSKLKSEFGQSGIRSSDFDHNNVVNASDFNIQKFNFGQAGHSLTCP